MAEDNRTAEQQAHVESHAPYMKIFGILLVFTILEYLYATFAPVGFGMLVLGLMTMAVIKAALVGAYFMHLKFEGRWVYLMLVPAGILATILVCALYPDIGMQPAAEPPPDDEEAYLSAPTGSDAPILAVVAR